MSKRAVFLSITVIIACLLWLGYYSCFTVQSDIVKGVTAERIKQLRVGMPVEEVTGILGNPYHVQSTSAGIHDLSCKHHKRWRSDGEIDIRAFITDIITDTNYCCDGNKQDMLQWDRSFELQYTRDWWLIAPSVKLYLILDSNVTLREVKAYIKDDMKIEPVYTLTDSTIFADEQKLMKYFE